jgi:hypothetical protein
LKNLSEPIEAASVYLALANAELAQGKLDSAKSHLRHARELVHDGIQLDLAEDAEKETYEQLIISLVKFGEGEHALGIVDNIDDRTWLIHFLLVIVRNRSLAQ